MTQTASSKEIQRQVIDLSSRVSSIGADISEKKRELELLESEYLNAFRDMESAIESLRAALYNEIRQEITQEKKWADKDRT